MNGCIFCKIARKDVPALIISEDELCLVMIDIKPTNPGHFLVLPKVHYQDLASTPDELIAKLFVVAKHVAAAALKAVGAQAFNTVVNTGVDAGQVIMHTHVHIIPRFNDDGLKHWPAKTMSEADMAKICEAIKSNLK